MTESEWLATDDLAAMVKYLFDGHPSWPKRLQGRPDAVSDRKLRLFACACVRQSWHLLTDDLSRRAVEIAERYADGLAAKAETFHAASSCLTIARCLMPSWESDAEAKAIIGLAEMHNPAALPVYAAILRDIIGNPWRPMQCVGCELDYCKGVSWLTPAVQQLAQTIYDDRAFALMLILADALEEAGCREVAILEHCREQTVRIGGNMSLPLPPPALHVRGCHVLDLLLNLC